MGAIELSLRCQQKVNGIAADPQPDWSFDNLLLELDSIEKNFLTSDNPAPFTKDHPRKASSWTGNYGSRQPFVMRVSDFDYVASDDEEEENHLAIIPGKRFTCDEIYMSDDSDNEPSREMQCLLMDKVCLVESALHELNRELQLSVSEEVRSKISSLETGLIDETEKLANRIAKVEKHRELQQERERKFDLQYQRTIAEALDNHLTAVQRDHEHISQLQERRIRDDAAREEAKKREKAMQEEKLRQERAKEEEARLKAERAEMARVAALKAEKEAEAEAAAKRAAETASNVLRMAENHSMETLGQSKASGVEVKNGLQSSARDVIRASENALELEKRRQKAYEELLKNNSLKQSTDQVYNRHAQNIGRRIKTITATLENVRTRADELVQLINSPGCPQPISIQLFVEKVISNCGKQKSSNAIFATARVIVLVTSMVPVAMDILIAELNKTCIYTVPKHIIYSEAAFTSKDAYYKAIGYVYEDGKIESTDDYLEKLSSYMKLYGAIVQTEIGGFQNLHGLKEGWAWLARFLNSLPANLYTAVALHSFLEMAGFTLYWRYKNQFEKLLRIIACDFLDALKEGSSDSWNAKLKKVKMSIQNYIDSNQFKKEPDGWQLRGHLDSSDFY